MIQLSLNMASDMSSSVDSARNKRDGLVEKRISKKYMD